VKTLQIFLTILIVMITADISILAKNLAKLKGDYLLYSFDYDYILGKGNIELKLKDFVATGDRIDIDIPNKRCRITSNVTIISGNNKLIKCDLFYLSLAPISFKCFNFKDTIESSGGKEKKSNYRFKSLTFTKLKESLLYFIGKEISIKNNWKIFGKEITAFVEGIQSVSFRSFRLNRGQPDRKSPFVINKLWYYKGTGLLGDISLRSGKNIKKIKLKTENNLRMKYDLFNKYSGYSAPGVYFKSKNSISLKDKNTLFVDLNYIKDNVSQAVMGYSFNNKKAVEANISVDLKKNFSSENKLWIRSYLKLDMKNAGILSLNYNYEKSRDYTGSFNYRKKFGKNLKLLAGGSFSGSRTGLTEFNKLSESRINLDYSTKIFNLSADYSLNSELLYNRSISSPKFNLNFIPVIFYKGLLNITVSSTAIFNNITRDGITENSFRSNTVMGLSSKKIKLDRSTNVEFSIRSEMLFDKDQSENYTSEGLIIKGEKKIFGNTNLEFRYNYFTRRRTKNWFIEGTAASDITMLLRNSVKNNKSNFWGSISYDIDMGRYTSSYLNFELFLVKNWYLQTLVNYDFIFKNLTYNVYLERKAGKYKFRISYRSLMKQFQLEVLPN